jgi:hypothetical protein
MERPLLLMSLWMLLWGPVEVCRRRASSSQAPSAGAVTRPRVRLLWVGARFRSVDEAGFCVLETWIGSSLRRF